MKNITPFIFVTLFLMSFSNYGQETSQMQHVITTHDEVMAKMPKLVKLINELNPKVDSTKAGQKYKHAIDDLKASNKSMMNWMQSFGERFTADEMLKGKELTTQKKKWLNEEEKKISLVSKEINSSIQQAAKLLKN